MWSQVVVGTTVYAGGSFSNARPAGSAPGTNLVPRSNLLAYNITTGVLVPTFAPQRQRPGPVRGRVARRQPHLRRG